MIHFRPAVDSDVPLIEAQIQQQIDKDLMMRPALSYAVGRTMAFAGVVDDRPIGIAGVIPKWSGTLSAWALFSPACGPYMLPIVRFVRHVFDTLPQKRIEAAVLYDFANGHKLARQLGFKLEAVRMRCYDPAGRDCSLYARIRP